jgi:hemerythrin superfamily protein
MTTRTTTRSRRSPARTGRRGPTDAIALLKADHRAVDDLFQKFDKTGERAMKTRASLVDRMITELTVHAAIEEAVLYPAAREALPDDAEVLEALEEHRLVSWQLRELDGLDPDNERFDAKVSVLAETVRHHVREEERDLFPELRSAMSRTDLVELGSQLQNLKSEVPQRPGLLDAGSPVESVLPAPVSQAIDRALSTVRAGRS